VCCFGAGSATGLGPWPDDSDTSVRMHCRALRGLARPVGGRRRPGGTAQGGLRGSRASVGRTGEECSGCLRPGPGTTTRLSRAHGGRARGGQAAGLYVGSPSGAASAPQGGWARPGRAGPGQPESRQLGPAACGVGRASAPSLRRPGVLLSESGAGTARRSGASLESRRHSSWHGQSESRSGRTSRAGRPCFHA
jgi:hypothetical protein